MPGMIDTHRHMWQTAMRGYGADWTLTQYFVWYYLEHGSQFRPEDVHAGNLLSAWEALDAGVTTTVDWSHGLQTVDHAEAAVDALQAVPGRFVLAYGNIQAGPWEWTADPAVRAFLERRRGDDMLGFQIAFDVTGDPAFPEQAGLRGGPRARPAGHHPRRRVGRDQRRRHPADARARLHDEPERLRARRDADRPTPTTGSRPPAARSRCRPSPSRAPARATRPPGSCAGTTSRSRCRWTPACGGAATCSPRCAPRSAPTARASTSRRTPPATPSPTSHLRAEHVVDWATRGGARALGRDDLGSLEPGKKADVVLIKNDHSPVSFPLLNPYGHVAFQAQRGDVHTVLVDGRVVKHERRAGRRRPGRPCADGSRTTVEHLRRRDGRGGLGSRA